MTRRGFAVRAVLVIVAVTVASLAIRWPVLDFAGPLNPDEAEIMAAGRRAALAWWMPMETASANTYFPLWPAALGVLDALGLPMTLPVAHVLSALAYAALTSMVWIATARRWGWVASGILVVPAGFWALIAYFDFLSLTTEVPSMLVLVGAAILAFPSEHAVSDRRLALVAALASLAPWFKIQAGPLAVALVVSACAFAYLTRDRAPEPRLGARRSAVRTGAWLVAGGLAPTVFLVALMAVGGTLGLLWNEPVSFAHAYLTDQVRGIGVGEHTAPLSVKADVVVDQILYSLPVLGWVALGLRGVWLGGRRPHRALLSRTVVWVLPLLASLATLLVQWPLFPHYLNFLYAGAAIAAVAGSAFTPDPDVPSPSRRLVPLVRNTGAEAVVLAAVVSAIVPWPVGAVPELGVPTHMAQTELTRLCPAGQRVFVWGWAAELYSYYDWTPGSRYVTYGLLKATTPMQADYRARLLRELDDEPPSCVVSAVGIGWFFGHPDDPDVEEAIPATRALLERCYDRHEVAFSPDEVIDVWTRRPDC